MSAMLIIVVVSLLLPSGDVDKERQFLPAYYHNHYQSEISLRDTIGLGYRGVEVDVFLDNGQLLVGHDRSELRASETLESQYLAPLKRIVDERRFLIQGGRFLLNIEIKGGGRDAYDALIDLLDDHDGFVTTIRNGNEVPGAVDVVLVGWHPTIEELEKEPVRYVSIQHEISSLAPIRIAYPAHLVRMLTIHYDRSFQWTGRGRLPRRYKRRIEQLRVLAAANPGRLIRVITPPDNERVYQSLLGAGVDLIGTKHLGLSSRILR